MKSKKYKLVVLFSIILTHSFLLHAEDFSEKRIHAQASALIEKARQFNERRNPEALQKLDSCEVLLRQKPNRQLNTQYHLELSKYYKYNGEYAKAIAAATEASTLYLPQYSPSVKAEIEYVIGSTFYLLSDFKNAIHHLQVSSQLFDSLEMFTDFIHAQNALGSCFFSLEQIDLAAKYYEKVYQFAQNNSDSLLWYLSLNNLAAVSEEQPQRTVQLYQKAIEIAEDLNFEQDLSGLYMNVGLAYMNSENHDSAFFYFKQADRLQKVSHDTSTQVMIWHNMSLLLHHTHHNDSALFYAQKGIELAKKKQSELSTD